ncbi:acyl--CoA ligase [Mycobacterium sp. NBC_00419]|uniref:class I adenylate-forming enzyme family protein n=1 Tax=Mycobacterium sp. NBC_00419 TaxID=2975989 RepID=UPI002E23AAEB
MVRQLTAVVPDILGLLDGEHGADIALEDAAHRVTYAQLGPSARAIAVALARRGVRRGDRVAVVATNSTASVELYLGCALLGAVWVGINPVAPQAEQHRQLDLVTPRLVLRSAELAGVLEDRSEPFDGAVPDRSAPVAIAFSSGTTGTPKAHVHSRAGVSLAAAALAGANLERGDRVGVILPMSIHNVMVVGAMATLFAGATCVAVERMNAGAVAAACRDRRLTMLSALVPATIYDLVHDDAIAADALSSLRLAGSGAAGLAEELRAAFERKFGVPVVGSYGMTEAPGAVCLEDPALPHAPGACGRPLPHVSVVACAADGRVLPPGCDGELVVRAADSGRWARLYRPSLGVWTADGPVLRDDESFLATGDFGSVDDDGTVQVSGRRSDVIVRGGVNINAAEVESILGQIPQVRDIAVVGRTDARLGQRIVAFVEPAQDVTLDADFLRGRAREMVSHGKVPDDFVIGPLPRNAMGKVVKGTLTAGAETSGKDTKWDSSTVQ